MNTYKISRKELRRIIEAEAIRIESKSIVTEIAGQYKTSLLEKYYPNLNKEFDVGDEVVLLQLDPDAASGAVYLDGVIDQIYDAARDGIDVDVPGEGVYKKELVRNIWLDEEGVYPEIDTLDLDYQFPASIYGDDDTGSPGTDDDQREIVVPTTQEEKESLLLWLGKQFGKRIEDSGGGQAFKGWLGYQIAGAMLGDNIAKDNNIVKVIVNLFKNLVLTDIGSYFKKETAAIQLSDLMIDSIFDIFTAEGIAAPISNALGIDHNSGSLGDFIIGYMQTSFTNTISEGPIGSILKKEFAEILTNLAGEFDQMVEEWVNTHRSEVLERFKLDFKTGNDVIDGIVNTVPSVLGGLWTGAGNELGGVWDHLTTPEQQQENKSIRRLGHTLTSEQLRIIIKEEVTLLNNKQSLVRHDTHQLNEGVVMAGLVVTLGLGGIASAALYAYSDEVLEWLDDTPVGEWIKEEIGLYILSSLGWKGEAQPIKEAVMSVTSAIKLHKLDEYLDPSGVGAKPLAELIVKASLNLIARGIRTAILRDVIGITPTGTMGERIYRLIEKWLTGLAENIELSRALVVEITKLITSDEVGLRNQITSSFAKAKMKKPSLWDEFKQEMVQKALGIDDEVDDTTDYWKKFPQNAPDLDEEEEEE